MPCTHGRSPRCSSICSIITPPPPILSNRTLDPRRPASTPASPLRPRVISRLRPYNQNQKSKVPSISRQLKITLLLSLPYASCNYRWDRLSYALPTIWLCMMLTLSGENGADQLSACQSRPQPPQTQCGPMGCLPARRPSEVLPTDSFAPASACFLLRHMSDNVHATCEKQSSVRLWINSSGPRAVTSDKKDHCGIFVGVYT